MKKKEQSIEEKCEKRHKKQSIFMNVIGLICFALLIGLGYWIAGWFLRG